MDLYAEVKNGPGRCGGSAFARRGDWVLPPREMERGRGGWQPAEGVDAGRLPPWRTALAESDALVAELMDAGVLVMGVPVYNFGIPASLKAWVDMVARARLTFRYTENGPVGLLGGKRAFVVVATGGTAVGSEVDFATAYLRHVLGFLGIDDVEIIAADRVMPRGEDQVLGTARRRIEQLLPLRRPLGEAA